MCKLENWEMKTRTSNTRTSDEIIRYLIHSVLLWANNCQKIKRYVKQNVTKAVFLVACTFAAITAHDLGIELFNFTTVFSETILSIRITVIQIYNDYFMFIWFLLTTSSLSQLCLYYIWTWNIFKKGKCIVVKQLPS